MNPTEGAITLRLPHPEFAALVRHIRRDVVESRRASIAGLSVPYAVYRPNSDTSGIGACYDEDGAIYVEQPLVDLDARYADLVAFHEHLEIGHKLAGRSHAYAHRSAYLGELLAARDAFSDVPELRRYLDWRISGYPERKVPNPGQVAAGLARLLEMDRPRRGELLDVVKANRL